MHANCFESFWHLAWVTFHHCEFRVGKSEIPHIKQAYEPLSLSLKRNGYYSFPFEFQKYFQYPVSAVVGRKVSEENQEETGYKIIV